MAWFKFPRDADQITVEQQIFRPEFALENGDQLFRAPEHFSSQILDIPGFARVVQPEGAPEDLPTHLPRDQVSEVEKLSLQIGSLKLELDGLRATIAESAMEIDRLKLEKHELEVQLADFESEETEAKAKK